MTEKTKSKKEIVAINIALLQKPESYEEFQAGAFPNLPNMVGYTLRFKGYKKYEVYLVLNIAEGFEYENPLVEENNFVIMVINVSSLDYFLENLQQYTNPIIEVLKEVADKDGVSDRELPYGYRRDDDGNIKVNPAEAVIVKKPLFVSAYTVSLSPFVSLTLTVLPFAIAIAVPSFTAYLTLTVSPLAVPTASWISISAVAL